MNRSCSHISLLGYLGPIFVVAVALNFVWEVSQVSFFSGAENWGNIWWHCFVASLGDGLILWIIYAVGWLAFKQRDWFIHPGIKGYGVMLISGLSIALVIEWIALHLLQRWEYSSSMPLVPFVDIGLVPLLQMLVLPPVIFFTAGAWIKQIKNEPHKF